VNESTLASLTLVFMIAVATPVLISLPRRIRIPGVVLEIFLGILIGPEVLGWAHPETFTGLSEFGLAFLIFLAGFEVDANKLKGAPLRLAAGGWAISLVLGLGVGYLLHTSGVTLNTLVVGLAITTTALGTLLPILRDSGRLNTPFGTHVMAVGAVGEFGPIIAIALAFGSGTPAKTALSLLGFGAVAAVALWISTRPVPPKVTTLASRSLQNTGQLPIRLSLLVTIAMLWWTSNQGLDILLGAFTAGIVFRGFSHSGADESDVHAIESKLDAIGFGFLVPIFFIHSGMVFDLEALTSEASAWLKVPLFLVLMLVVRGVPVLVLYRKELPTRVRRGLALAAGAQLPLVVVVTTLGVEAGKMRPVNAAALVAAGMLSVLIYPLIGFRLATDPSTNPTDSTNPSDPLLSR